MIRLPHSADIAAILAINEQCIPAVGPMDRDKFMLFVQIAPFIRVLELRGEVAGVLVGMTEDSTRYTSPNFQWFGARHPKFSYVDRIALAPLGRGQGWGQSLYQAFSQWSVDQGKPVLCAEVNTIPDNPASHRFHRQFGFIEAARCRPYAPDSEVAMYEKRLVTDRPD